jgi:hypothetical protein
VRGGVLLDVTRTLSRLGHAADTGIDRVERAWRERVAASAGPAFFLARVSGGQVLLDRAGLAAALAGAAAPDLRARLSRKPGAVRLGESAARAAALGLAGPRGLARLLARHLPPGVTAFNLGHANLSDAVMAALGAAGARRVAMIHDTIPLDRPDLVRAESVPAHAARLRAAAAADLILANSADTAARIGHWLAALGLAAPPVRDRRAAQGARLPPRSLGGTAATGAGASRRRPVRLGRTRARGAAAPGGPRRALARAAR